MSVPLPSRRPGVTPRAGVLLALTAVVGVLAFLWPLVWRPDSATGWLGVVLLVACAPLSLGVVAAELANHSLDVKALAMLGVLSAVGAVVRPLGAGTAGIETVFFLLVIAGRVFGPGFGFVLGTTTLFASALLTGGIGVWLPYQMLAAAFVGFGAGLLPRAPRWAELPLLSTYGALAAFVFGSLMDLSFWPFALGGGGGLSYDPSASGWVNLHRFAVYELVTGTGWNLGRAVTTVVLLLVLGRPLLHVLRRAARRASFAS
ncbi:MAG TPA: ECF transporter S component [Propionibacteriaceae bacterium]|nr:ECF transporter S component [Propionibacteriaceae bacterium]